MHEKARVFKSVWTYAFWLLLTGDQVWNGWRHFHPLGPSIYPAVGFWPVFHEIANLLGQSVCIFIAIYLYKFTTNRLEKAGIFFFGLSSTILISVSLNQL